MTINKQNQIVFVRCSSVVWTMFNRFWSRGCKFSQNLVWSIPLQLKFWNNWSWELFKIHSSLSDFVCYFTTNSNYKDQQMVGLSCSVPVCIRKQTQIVIRWLDNGNQSINQILSLSFPPSRLLPVLRLPLIRSQRSQSLCAIPFLSHLLDSRSSPLCSSASST